MPRNKEEIYDEDISPLMDKIIKVCLEHNIGMAATFHIPTPTDPGLRVSTMLYDRTKDMGNDIDRAITTILRLAGTPSQVENLHPDAKGGR